MIGYGTGKNIFKIPPFCQLNEEEGPTQVKCPLLISSIFKRIFGLPKKCVKRQEAESVKKTRSQNLKCKI